MSLMLDAHGSRRAPRRAGLLIAGCWAACLAVAGPAPAAASQVLTLPEAVEIGLKQNPDLIAARRELELARSKGRQAYAGVKPSLSVSGGYAHDDLLAPAAAKETPSAALSLSETFPLRRLWGGPVPALLTADHGLKAADRALARAEQNVKYQVLSTYVGVLQAKSNLEIAQRKAERTAAFLKDTTSRFDLGTASALDVSRAETDLQAANAGIDSARHALELARWKLNQALGRPLTDSIDAASIDTGARPMPEYEALLQTALANRPEILGAQESLERDQVARAAAKPSWLPTVAFTAGATKGDTSATLLVRNADRQELPAWYLSTGLSQDIIKSGSGSSSDQKLGWNAGVSASLPLFDWGIRRESDRQESIDRAKLEAALEQAKNGVRLEMRSAYLAWVDAEQNVQVRQKGAEQADKDVALAEQRFRAGAVTSRDVLDAEIDRLEAASAYAQALYNRLTTRAQLLRAAGLDPLMT